MTVNPLTLSRQTLHGLVWSKPLVEIAKQFNMSDVGLAKRCRAVDVPVPYRGYWARRAAGQEPPKTPLPKYRSQSMSVDSKRKSNSVPRAEVKEGTEPVIAFAPLHPKAEKEAAFSSPTTSAAYAQIDAIAVSSLKTPDTMHPAVKRSAIALAANRLKDFGWTKGEREGPQIEIDVSEESKVRALQIANLIVKGCESVGWTIVEKAKPPSNPRWESFTEDVPDYARFAVDGEQLRFRIDERRRQTPHRITREERARTWSSPPPWDLIPSGELRVHLCEESRWSFKTFKDGVRRLLDEQLSSILRALYDRSQELKIGRASCRERV